MKLPLDARQVVVSLIEQAHEECATPDGFAVAEVAGRFVDLVADLQKYGHGWVEEYVRDLAIVGAKQICADWRRSHQIASKTPKGTKVSVPRYAGTKAARADGKVVALQLPLRDFSREQLVDHVAKLERQRNTVSTELQFLKALVAYMSEHAECETAGSAIDALGLAA